MNGLIPGLPHGWIAADEIREKRNASELQRAQGLMQIQGLLQKRQEEGQIRGVLSEAKGDPAMALKGLLTIGTPTALTMANNLKGMMPKPAEPYTLAPGGQRRGVNNELLAEAPNKPVQDRAPLKLDQLMSARDALPPNDPRRPIYDNAIRKESETAKQISPTIVMPWQNRIPPGYRQTPDGNLTFIPGGPADPASKPKVERALPSPLQNKLTEAAELADATDRFRTTFKEGFAGKTLTGDLSNTMGRMLGDDSGQAQWWQDYELHQSQVRNKLFGSALTAPEIEAWNKSAINPRMESGEVRKNLTRRETLEKRGLERLMRGAAAGGYNQAQIEAFTGRSVSGQPTAPPTAPSAPAKVSSEAEYNALPSGATYLAPDGSTRTKK